MSKPFQKGNQYGKLGGRPPVPKEIRELHACTKAMILETMSEYMGYSFEKLKEVASDPNQAVYKMFVARVILRGIRDGDVRFLDFVCERFLAVHTKSPKLIDLSDEDVLHGLRSLKAGTG